MTACNTILSFSHQGYGDITPITSGARILTVLVQVIGIPINLYMFASIAAFLTKCISCLKSSIASKCQRRRASKPNIACFFFCIFLVLLYVGAGGIAVGLSQGLFDKVALSTRTHPYQSLFHSVCACNAVQLHAIKV